MSQIRLEKVTKRFEQTLAVNAVDLSIGAGEMFFLLGPSGCGKTTLMRIVAGLTECDSGAVYFGERDVTRWPTARRNTALVFQSYALWPHMTVAQNVAFGLDVRGVSSAEKGRRVADALKAVRLDALAHRRPGQLSGGQQQRVALARALVVRPDVLLLDEPLSNLDAALRQEMRGEIRRLCTEFKLTTVYVTHDQQEALSIADRIALMRDGAVQQVGCPMDVYRRPASRFVAEFLGGANLIEAVTGSTEHGRLRLETPLGPLWSESFEAWLRPGSKVTCCVRPEAVRIAEHEPGPGVNSLTVRHLHTLYLGHVAEHVFQTRAVTQICVEEFKPVPRTWVETVRLAFDAQDLVVMSR